MNVVSQAHSHSTKLCRLFVSAYDIGRKLTQKGLQCVFRSLSFSEAFSYSVTNHSFVCGQILRSTPEGKCGNMFSECAVKSDMECNPTLQELI